MSINTPIIDNNEDCPEYSQESSTQYSDYISDYASKILEGDGCNYIIDIDLCIEKLSESIANQEFNTIDLKDYFTNQFCSIENRVTMLSKVKGVLDILSREKSYVNGIGLHVSSLGFLISLSDSIRETLSFLVVNKILNKLTGNDLELIIASHKVEDQITLLNSKEIFDKIPSQNLLNIFNALHSSEDAQKLMSISGFYEKISPIVPDNDDKNIKWN